MSGQEIKGGDNENYSSNITEIHQPSDNIFGA